MLLLLSSHMTTIKRSDFEKTIYLDFCSTTEWMLQLNSVTSGSVNLGKPGRYVYMLLFITYQVIKLQESDYKLE